jgi:hypothetical protein
MKLIISKTLFTLFAVAISLNFIQANVLKAPGSDKCENSCQGK